MLLALLKKGYGQDLDLNCAEKILYGANQAYQLGLNKEALKLAAGFGGGMAIENKCGALIASIMVLGKLFVQERAHESDKIKKLTRKLFEEYQMAMGSIDCKPLKDSYRTEKEGCQRVIFKAAEILDQIVVAES